MGNSRVRGINLEKLEEHRALPGSVPGRCGHTGFPAARYCPKGMSGAVEEKGRPDWRPMGSSTFAVSQELPQENSTLTHPTCQPGPCPHCVRVKVKSRPPRGTQTWRQRPTKVRQNFQNSPGSLVPPGFKMQTSVGIKEQPRPHWLTTSSHGTAQTSLQTGWAGQEAAQAQGAVGPWAGCILPLDGTQRRETLAQLHLAHFPSGGIHTS